VEDSRPLLGRLTSARGNVTVVARVAPYGSNTMWYDDESRLASITYGGVTDTYAYNWQGLRRRATLNGTVYRYLYNGERLLQEVTTAGVVNATYTTENDSYYGSLLHIQRATGESRFPLYDEIGTARGLVDASGAVSDTYDMDTFGRPLSSTGTTRTPTDTGRPGATSPTLRASPNSARGTTGRKWGGLSARIRSATMPLCTDMGWTIHASMSTPAGRRGTSPGPGSVVEKTAAPRARGADSQAAGVAEAAVAAALRVEQTGRARSRSPSRGQSPSHAISPTQCRRTARNA
jgi:hypothetical protein